MHQFVMTLSVLTCQSAVLKYVNSVSIYFQLDKNLYIIDFCYDLPNDGKQKQVKATEVYLLRRMTEHTC